MKYRKNRKKINTENINTEKTCKEIQPNDICLKNKSKCTERYGFKCFDGRCIGLVKNCISKQLVYYESMFECIYVWTNSKQT